MEGDEVFHNELHITEPVKMEMLCTLVDSEQRKARPQVRKLTRKAIHSLLKKDILFLFIVGFRGCQGLGQIAVIGVGVCFGGDSLGYFYSNSNSDWRYIIAQAMTLVLPFLNPLLYRNIRF